MKIEISSRELLALKNVLNYCMDDEEEDARRWTKENNICSDFSTIKEKQLQGHVYYELLLLEKLYNREKNEQ